MKALAKGYKVVPGLHYGTPKEVFESPKSERFRQFLAGTLK